MRNYQLYLIDNEFARHYFGRELMFYNLFKDYSEALGEKKSILSKQIDYITKPIPCLKLQQYIRKYLQKNKDFREENGVYFFKNKKIGTSSLELFEKKITIKANGTFDAETLFFEALRKYESSYPYLAIDLDNRRYGWLKPIKERKFVLVDRK